MRLGAWKCDIKEGSLAIKFMVNQRFLSVTVTVMSTIVLMLMCRKAGLSASGINPDTGLRLID
jgi:hypothetical protein